MLTKPSKTDVEPPSPDLEASTFLVGSDEYLVLSFPVSGSVLGATTPASFEAARGLTAAQREVAASIVAGLTNVEIAHRRGVSSRTIANQITEIYRKLGVSSRRELRALRVVPKTRKP